MSDRETDAARSTTTTTTTTAQDSAATKTKTSGTKNQRQAKTATTTTSNNNNDDSNTKKGFVKNNEQSSGGNTNTTNTPNSSASTSSSSSTVSVSAAAAAATAAATVETEAATNHHNQHYHHHMPQPMPPMPPPPSHLHLNHLQPTVYLVPYPAPPAGTAAAAAAAAASTPNEWSEYLASIANQSPYSPPTQYFTFSPSPTTPTTNAATTSNTTSKSHHHNHHHQQQQHQHAYSGAGATPTSFIYSPTTAVTPSTPTAYWQPYVPMNNKYAYNVNDANKQQQQQATSYIPSAVYYQIVASPTQQPPSHINNTTTNNDNISGSGNNKTDNSNHNSGSSSIQNNHNHSKLNGASSNNSRKDKSLSSSKLRSKAVPIVAADSNGGSEDTRNGHLDVEEEQEDEDYSITAGRGGSEKKWSDVVSAGLKTTTNAHDLTGATQENYYANTNENEPEELADTNGLYNHPMSSYNGGTYYSRYNNYDGYYDYYSLVSPPDMSGLTLLASPPPLPPASQTTTTTTPTAHRLAFAYPPSPYSPMSTPHSRPTAYYHLAAAPHHLVDYSNQLHQQTPQQQPQPLNYSIGVYYSEAVENKFNPPDYKFTGEAEDGRPGRNVSKFFVIKSYSKEDVVHSIKHGIWCSTTSGNARLNEAFDTCNRSRGSGAGGNGGSVYLFFSVNSSGQFCGCAEMVSRVDFNAKSELWSQDKWRGKFDVKWIYVKDVPNSKLRHILLPNNEMKPVTNSRDAQEILHEQGAEMFAIMRAHKHRSTILDEEEYGPAAVDADDSDTSGHVNNEMYMRNTAVVPSSSPPSNSKAHSYKQQSKQLQNSVPSSAQTAAKTSSSGEISSEKLASVKKTTEIKVKKVLARPTTTTTSSASSTSAAVAAVAAAIQTETTNKKSDGNDKTRKPLT